MSAMRTLRKQMSKNERPLTRPQAFARAVIAAALWSWRRHDKLVRLVGPYL